MTGRDHKDELIQIFAEYLGPNDIFYMPDILYFGGTVSKDISSNDIITALREKGINAFYRPDKQDVQSEIITQAKAGDIICIMGARDDSLREMARSIFQYLR